MAITKAADYSGTTAGSALSYTITGVTASIGQVVVVICHMNTGSSQSVSSISDGVNTYTFQQSAFQSGANSRCEAWTAPITSALSSATVTVTQTASVGGRAEYVIYDGAASPVSVDVKAGLGSAATTTPAAVTVTTTDAGDVVVGGITYPNTGAPSAGPGAGFAALTGGTPGTTLYGTAAYAIPGSTGTYGPAWTLPASVASGAVTIALKPLSGTTIVVPAPATATAAGIVPALVVSSTIVVPTPATATAAGLVPTVGATQDNTIVVPSPATASASALTPTIDITFPPPTIAGPTWYFELADSATMTPITELGRATNRNLKFVLNRPGSCSFDLALDAPGAIEIAPIKTCIKAWQFDHAGGYGLRFSGPVWTINEDVTNNKMSVTAVGWYELLNHRYLVADVAPDTSTAGVTNGSFATNSTGWVANSASDSQFARTTGTGHDGAVGIGRILEVAGGNTSGGFGTTTGTLVANQIYRVSFWVYTPNPGAPLVGPRLTVRFGKNSGVGQTFVVGSYSPPYEGLPVDIWTNYTFDYVHPNGAATVSPSASLASWNSGTGFGINFAVVAGYPGSSVFIDDITITKVGSLQIGYRYYDTVKADTIAYNLLTSLNEENPSESLPVAVGTSVETPVANPTRIRTYKRYTNVGQAIQELSDIENGFDFEVDPSTRALNIYHSTVSGTIYGKGSVKTDIRFGYLANPMNLISFSRQIDGQTASNDTIVLGKYGAGRAIELSSITTAGTASWAGASGGLGYRLQDVISLSDVPDVQGVLIPYANVETTLRAFPRVTYSFVPRPFAPNVAMLRPFYDYGLGDIVYVSASRGRVLVLNQAVRIFGIDISIDDAGVERVTNISTSPAS